MVLVGIVKKYNKKFGTIVSDDKKIDFEKTDISLNQDIEVGDTVEFRVEVKPYNVLIARNISKVNN